jgi:hypothetical protein
MHTDCLGAPICHNAAAIPMEEGLFCAIHGASISAAPVTGMQFSLCVCFLLVMFHRHGMIVPGVPRRRNSVSKQFWRPKNRRSRKIGAVFQFCVAES